MAEPTITPSESSAIRLACSGVEIPKPMAAGIWVFCRTVSHHGGQIRFDLASGSGNAQRGHHIENPSASLAIMAILSLGGRCDEGDQLHPILPANRQEFLLLLKGADRGRISPSIPSPAGGEKRSAP